jgi:hypothetical protein
MPITLNLTPKEEAVLQKQAARYGMTAEQYIRRRLAKRTFAKAILRKQNLQTLNKLPKSPSDAYEYWKREGVFDVFPTGTDSIELADLLRRQAETRG